MMMITRYLIVLLKWSIGLSIVFCLGCGSLKREAAKDAETLWVQLVRSATIRLDMDGKLLLVDPVLGKRGSQDPIPFSNDQSNPLVDLPFEAEQVLSGVDAVLVTHLHPDHFDAAAVALVPKDMLIFCQPSDKEGLAQKGFTNLVGIDQSFDWSGIRLSRYGASHYQGAMGEPPFGESSSYGIHFQGKKILITGDAIWDDKLKTALNAVAPEVVIANTGECQFSEPNDVLEPGVTMTLTKEELEQLSNEYPSVQIIAVHLEAINHCMLSREVLRGHIREKGLEHRIVVPNDGDTVIL